ncbi:hypothetical protein GRI94_14580 [Erythrobacter jejuensis]|uniref:Uncharacterized protein n=1 Tax=Parerythrobacter jejuensis TaxID=795812 RepID=A0A845AL04_9SPHN|nr:hypothetical protein [Parerythrobacter jejuensis]MXP33054.1 hypothetical protein [Parerythrobacter jejuensis]
MNRIASNDAKPRITKSLMSIFGPSSIRLVNEFSGDVGIFLTQRYRHFGFTLFGTVGFCFPGSGCCRSNIAAIAQRLRQR